MQGSGKIKYLVASLASALLFGAATPASKILLQGIQPQALAGLLYLGAALGVLPIVVRNGAFRWPWHAGHRTLLLLTGAIVLGGILAPVLLLIALRSAHAGSVSLWLNLELAATVVLGHFMFREHLTLRGWIAAAGTFIASMILVGGTGGGGMIPIILVLLGCICWGLDNHFTALIDGLSPAQTTLWKGVVAGTVNTVIGYVASSSLGQPLAVFMGLLVGVFSYGISITLYVTAAQGMGAARSQMFFSTAPFFGLLLSVIVLGETFTAVQVVAAGLMVISLVVLFSEKHEHVHRHAFLSHQHSHRHKEFHHDHAHDGLHASESHSHWHEHNADEHDHKHWPDLHHRHNQEDDKASKPSDE